MFRLQDFQMNSIQELTCWRNAAAVKLEIRNLNNLIYLQRMQMSGVPVRAGQQYHGTRFRSVFRSLLEEISQTLYHKQCFLARDGGHFNLYGTACDNSVVSEAASFHVRQRKGHHGIGLSQTWREAFHFRAEDTVELYKWR